MVKEMTISIITALLFKSSSPMPSLLAASYLTATCYLLLSSSRQVVETCKSTGTGISQQSALQIVTPNYSLTSASKSPSGSCGHSKYWNSGESAGGIVGGRQTLINEFPWQVYLTTSSSSCGGSIISSNYVLTAGHCVYNYAASAIKIMVGAYNKSVQATTVGISSYTIHPNYTIYDNVSINDIAIVRLSTSLTFSTNWNIQPICLPTSCSDTAAPGEFAVLSGWGLADNGTQPDILRSATMMILSNYDCANYYQDSYIYENTVCAGTVSAASCPGDSGGPLASFKKGYFTLMGLVSNGGYCTEAYKGPSVFTRVCSFTTWINSYLTSG